MLYCACSVLLVLCTHTHEGRVAIWPNAFGPMSPLFGGSNCVLRQTAQSEIVAILTMSFSFDTKGIRPDSYLVQLYPCVRLSYSGLGMQFSYIATLATSLVSRHLVFDALPLRCHEVCVHFMLQEQISSKIDKAWFLVDLVHRPSACSPLAKVH